MRNPSKIRKDEPIYIFNQKKKNSELLEFSGCMFSFQVNEAIFRIF